MSEIKTIKEWLSELPEPTRSQALENMNPLLENKREGCLWGALTGAFNWEDSPQGHSYWSAITWDGECAQVTDESSQFSPSPWQPIDTAPADGTYVLVCCSGKWESFPHRLPKSAYFGTFRKGYIGNMCWRDIQGSPIEPTHWMPLPESPQS